MRFFLITIFLSFTISLLCQNDSVNYFDYHNKINKAEILYFVEKDVDDSLKLYDSIFEAYEFVFLKDLLVAAQIAKFNKKEYKKYIIQSFEFGFKIDDLKKIPILESDYKKFVSDKSVKYAFKEARKKYLSKIDFKYLDFIYDLAIKDQVDKHKDDYVRRIDKTIEKLMDTIKKEGFLEKEN